MKPPERKSDIEEIDALLKRAEVSWNEKLQKVKDMLSAKIAGKPSGSAIPIRRQQSTLSSDKVFPLDCRHLSFKEEGEVSSSDSSAGGNESDGTDSDSDGNCEIDSEEDGELAFDEENLVNASKVYEYRNRIR